MPPATRRYEIQLSVNASAGTGAPGAPGGTPATPASLDGMIDRIGRYLLGMQGIRMAWRAAQSAMEEYYDEQKKKLDNMQQSAKAAVASEIAQRQYFFTAGAKNNPMAIPQFKSEGERLQVLWGMESSQAASDAMRTYNTDVKGYVGVKGKDQASHLSPDQWKNVREKVGQMAQIRGVNQEQSARLLSSIVASTDWQKEYGDKAGDTVIAGWEQFMTGTQFSHADQGVNIDNISKMIRESVKPDRSQSIVKSPGLEAIKEVVRMGVELGEVKPAQAEMSYRNALIFMYNLKNKAFAKTMKGAGIGYEDSPLNVIQKMVTQYEKAQDDGKVAPGENFEQWLKAEAKSPMRGGFGIQSIMLGESVGLGPSASAAMNKVTPENAYSGVMAVGKQMQSIAAQQAKAMTSVADVRSGQRYMGSEAYIESAEAMAYEKGHWGQLDDPRNAAQKGWGHKLFNLNPFGDSWDEGREGSKHKVGDSAQAMLYRMMLQETRKGEGRQGSAGFVPKSEDLYNEYMKYGRTTQGQLFQSVFEDVGRQFGSDKYTEIFERMVAALEAQAPKNLPPTPQAFTLIH